MHIGMWGWTPPSGKESRCLFIDEEIELLLRFVKSEHLKFSMK